ncbi:FkbM family methyltransferase [Xanthomonas floridensis]|uniref:FkbM family methyltransferase n=1 Tax=Xanthomonas floridensis TaxID=1843580 RepID=A0ABU5PT81_9XANT|nr:FkbM family methyltransferase [Xanthomonas floridensis]MEA5122806.1 FkbM family methyltransferase [Xanthomonas floridensis]MEA5131153.1 FkbM family methyltransferase [Xanthomonas floridensis]
MTEGIISYAQNFEDVMLWRALGGVAAGNYVDVGAQSAFEDSVSRAFHEHGWKGVHVEPMSFYADQLRTERSGDVVLQVMVGSHEGIGEFFAMSGTGLSTSREDLAKDYQRDGHEVRREVVPIVTLDKVLEIVDGEIHWLKIDVEGAERQVLEGWLGNRRPWVLVIESTKPMSQEQSHDEWEALVTSKGYRFVYFDGLNRFYVNNAHPEIEGAFRIGPNVFDRFCLAGTATSTFSAKLKEDVVRARHELWLIECENARLHAEQATSRDTIIQLERELLQQRIDSGERERALLIRQTEVMAGADALQERLERERDAAVDDVARLYADLRAIHASTSWVVTGPMRSLSRLARWTVKMPRLVLRRLAGRGKTDGRRFVHGVTRRAARSPVIRRLVRRMLAASPRLETRVRSIHRASMGADVVDYRQRTFAEGEVCAVSPKLSAPLPDGISAHARQSLLRLRYAVTGSKH